MVRAWLALGAVLAMTVGGLSPASADDQLPVRKPGLWEIRIKLTGGAAPTAMMRHCTDETVDRQMSTLFNPLSPPPCSKSNILKEADHYTISSSCTADDKIVKVMSDVSGDFQTSYTVVTETKTQDDPDSDPTLTSMTLEGKYTGACKWGQKAGDVVMAGGLKVNIKDMDAYKKLPRR
jgi:hypothetical protein